MPSLGADMERGTVVEWLVHPGDHVRRGDVVAVVDTDKATIEVEVFEDGVVEELLVPAGTDVPVGTPLARIGAGTPAPAAVAGNGEAVRAAAGPGIVVSPVVRHQAERLGVDLQRVQGSGAGGRVLRADVERIAAAPHRRVSSSPRARRLATQLGTDLDSVAGTGPGGAVRGIDVERAAAAASVAGHPKTAEAPEQTKGTPDRRAAMRTAIANLMSRSQREIPHYYLSTTIDLFAALEWLAACNGERPPDRRILPAALLLKATARAAAEVPGFNGFWVDGGFQPAAAVHVGVAISLRGGGLIAPAIHDCDRLSVDETMAGLRDIVGRARKGALRASEMADPTITVTNLGDQGVEAVFGVIYPPQVALVGFGRVNERPWASGGMLGVRPVVTATLSADHRASDGHQGGLFLAAVDRLLQDPPSL